MYSGKVVWITGASSGIGEALAVAFSKEGAQLVLSARRRDELERVRERCKQAGRSNADHLVLPLDVTDHQSSIDAVESIKAGPGRIDVLIANAGILLDKSFAKMEMDDFLKVINVHLIGTTNCARAVWPVMREQNYGRLVFTTSSSGMYGNFGQANYGAAKTGMIGLMNVLQIEGEKNNIHVNTLSPTAVTRMTEELFHGPAKDLLTADSISPGVLFLASKEGPKRTILCAGGGCFARTYLHETEGVILLGDDLTPEGVAREFDRISDMDGARALQGAFEQTQKYAEKAEAAVGAKE